MRQFVVLFSHKNRKNLERSLLQQHIEHLKKLKRAGVLVLCGPLGDDDRAMMILKCASKEEGTLLVEKDPFVKEKYYGFYEIVEWIEANEENDWLMSHPQTKKNQDLS